MEVSLNYISRYIRSSVRITLKKAEGYYIENIDPFHKWKIGELEGKSLKDVIESYLTEGKHNILNQYTGRQIEILKNAIEKYIRKKKKIPDNDTVALNKIFKDCKNKIKHKDWLDIRKNYQELKNDEYKEKFLNSSYDENIKFEDSKDSGNSGAVSSSFNKNTDVIDNLEIYSDTDVLYSDLLSRLNSLNPGADWLIEINENNSDEYEYLILIINNANPSEKLDSYILEVKKIIRTVSRNCNIQSHEKNDKNYLIGYFNLD